MFISFLLFLGDEIARQSVAYICNSLHCFIGESREAMTFNRLTQQCCQKAIFLSNYFHVPLSTTANEIFIGFGWNRKKESTLSMEIVWSHLARLRWRKRNFALRGAIKRRRWQRNRGVMRCAFVSAEKSQWSPFIGKFDVDSAEQWDLVPTSGSLLWNCLQKEWKPQRQTLCFCFENRRSFSSISSRS